MPKPKCISYLFSVGFHLFFVYFLVLTFTPRMCSIKCHFLSTPFYQGFWVVSTSEDEVSELKSYESGGNEEISKEESEEVSEEEESVNDVEVMEILEQAEAHKQDQSKMQLEPVSMDKSDNINNVKVDNLRIETTLKSANESEKKVCI